VKFGAGQPYTQQRASRRTRCTTADGRPRWVRASARSTAPAYPRLLRDLPAHAAGSGTPSMGVDTLPDGGTNGCRSH